MADDPTAHIVDLEEVFQRAWSKLAGDLAPQTITAGALEAALPGYMNLGEKFVSLDRATMAELTFAIDVLGREVLDAAEGLKALVCLQAYRQLEGAGSGDPALPTRARPDGR